MILDDFRVIGWLYKEPPCTKTSLGASATLSTLPGDLAEPLASAKGDRELVPLIQGTSSLAIGLEVPRPSLAISPG